jgi:hypothetical protein
VNSENKPTPKLAESDEISSAFGATPKRKASDRLIANFVPTSNEPISQSLIKITRALLSLLVAFIIALLSVWLILVSTVAATPKMADDILIIDRNAWSKGGAEAGDIAYVSQANGQSAIDKVLAHLSGEINNGEIVRIIATPLDYVNTNVEGYIVVNGLPTRYPSDIIIDRKQLGDTYLSECLEGSCGIPGTLYEIPITNVLGSVEGILKFFKIEEYAR